MSSNKPDEVHTHTPSNVSIYLYDKSSTYAIQHEVEDHEKSHPGDVKVWKNVDNPNYHSINYNICIKML